MTHPSRDRWLHTSCLQKSIRRNLPEWAVPSARFLWAFSPKYLVRRLVVIAFEDIGLANLDLLERYLETASPMLREARFSSADREKVIGLVRAFCASSKSRYLTRVGVLPHYHPKYREIHEETKRVLFTDPVAEAWEAKDIPTAHAKALACKPKDLALALERNGYERLARLMTMGTKLGAEGLPLGLFATRDERQLNIHSTDLPSIVTVGSFPTWVYDKHTRIGAKALRVFTATVPELAHLPKDKAEWVAYRTLFRLESGLLDREVMFTSNAEVEEVWWQTMMIEGASIQEVTAWRHSLQLQLPRLNAIRRELVG